MPGNRCPAREKQAMAMLIDNGDMSALSVANEMGVKVGTAGQYLQQLKRQGLASNTGLGATAVWSARPPEPKVPKAIVQCSSVWEYAARMA
jgi:predicted ArsR family transcriptional regulator